MIRFHGKLNVQLKDNYSTVQGKHNKSKYKIVAIPIY